MASDHQEHDITALLTRWRDGDESERAAARDELVPLVYEDLRAVARRLMGGERTGHTLDPTALVNEAWIRVSEGAGLQADNRRHFAALAAQVMRRVLVDYGRGRAAAKRGGERQRVTLELEGLDVAGAGGADVEVIDLARALDALEATEGGAELVRVVELKYFAGMTVEEVGDYLGIARPTAWRRWRTAKVWLYRRLAGEAAHQ